MFDSRDTIAAIATAQQNAGVGVVRISGGNSLPILKSIFRKPNGKVAEGFLPRTLTFGKIVDAQEQLLDEVLVTWMPAPNSFTGEDVVELQCHGNVHLLRAILRRVLETANPQPTRLAEPGEFTKRAFINGKMDLTQAEAVQDLIAAQSEMSYRANLANLDGALSRQIRLLKEKLLASLALVEASFEFPEEDIQTYNAKDVLNLLAEAQAQLSFLLRSYQTSKLYDEGVRVAIVGRPNVGKSSLLNALLLEDRAIVTPIAGTTRDVVQGSKIIQGLRFHFFDTAGLRDTTDVVEGYGIQRSKESAEKADLVLYITDSLDVIDMPRFSTQPHLLILNKADLFSEIELGSTSNCFAAIVSAKHQTQLTELEMTICTRLLDKSVQNYMHINERQRAKITEADQSVHKVLQNWHNFNQAELLAEELRQLVSAKRCAADLAIAPLI